MSQDGERDGGGSKRLAMAVKVKRKQIFNDVAHSRLLFPTSELLVVDLDSYLVARRIHLLDNPRVTLPAAPDVKLRRPAASQPALTTSTTRSSFPAFLAKPISFPGSAVMRAPPTAYHLAPSPAPSVYCIGLDSSCLAAMSPVQSMGVSRSALDKKRFLCCTA